MLTLPQLRSLDLHSPSPSKMPIKWQDKEVADRILAAIIASQDNKVCHAKFSSYCLDVVATTFFPSTTQHPQPHTY